MSITEQAEEIIKKQAERKQSTGQQYYNYMQEKGLIKKQEYNIPFSPEQRKFKASIY